MGFGGNHHGVQFISSVQFHLAILNVIANGIYADAAFFCNGSFREPLRRQS